jgi:hypothetical protein
MRRLSAFALLFLAFGAAMPALTQTSGDDAWLRSVGDAEKQATPCHSVGLAVRKIHQDYRNDLVEAIQGNFIYPKGVSEQARETVPRVTKEMLRRVPLDILVRLQACRAGVLVVPRDKPLTDFPPFSRLGDAERFAVGISWPNEDGQASALPDGSVFAAVKDRTFTDPDLEVPHEYVLAHEWAHVIHQCALTPAQRELVEELFSQHGWSDEALPTGYSRLNGGEYFAESVSVWFGVRPAYRLVGTEEYTNVDWIRRFDPKMYFLLETLFGAPRSFGT